MKCNFIRKYWDIKKSKEEIKDPYDCKCQNDAFEGLVCCWEHANDDTKFMYICMILRENKELKMKIESMMDRLGHLSVLDEMKGIITAKEWLDG